MIAELKKQLQEYLLTMRGSFGLFDNEGEVKRTTGAVADIINWFDQSNQRGQRVTDTDLVRYFSCIPYGWDPNLIRVIASALFCSNLLLVRYEGSDYRDYTVERAQGIFIDSRKFNRAELILETEEPLTPRELQNARQEVEIMFKTHHLQETPFAIAEVLRQKTNECLEEYRRLKAWVDGSRFPVDDIFTTAPDVLKDVIETGCPNALVRKFLDRVFDFQKAVRSIVEFSEFYDTPQNLSKFNDMVRFLPIGRFLLDRVPKNEMPNTMEATDFLEERFSERTLRERFSEAQTCVLQAIPELRAKLNELKKRTIETISKATDGILAFGKQEGLQEKELSKYLSELQNRKETIESAEFDLHSEYITIQSLWTGASGVEAIDDHIRREIEAEAVKKKGSRTGILLVRKRLRLRELKEVPRVIGNEEDLSKTLKGIENAMKDALKNNEEVELF